MPRPSSAPKAVEISRPNELIAGRRSTGVYNVTRPTMTIYSPTGNNTGAAVVVFPGGGYQMLAIDLEGTEVCDWLVPRGITCILLKYRVPGNPALYPKSGPYPESPMALEDAQRTMGLLRLHAAEYHIDPHKIGVLGFSAGGHLVAAISNHYDHRIYHRIDAADDQSCRPDFAIAIYPGHLAYGAAVYDASLSKNKSFMPPPNNAPHAVPTSCSVPTFMSRATRRPPSSCRTRTTTSTTSTTRSRTTSRFATPASPPKCTSIHRAATPSVSAAPSSPSPHGRSSSTHGCSQSA